METRTAATTGHNPARRAPPRQDTRGPGHVMRSARRTGKQSNFGGPAAPSLSAGVRGSPGCRTITRRLNGSPATRQRLLFHHRNTFLSDVRKGRDSAKGQRERTRSPEGLLSGAGLGRREAQSWRATSSGERPGWGRARPPGRSGQVRKGGGCCGVCWRRRRPDPCPSQERGGKRRWWSRS